MVHGPDLLLELGQCGRVERIVREAFGPIDGAQGNQTGLRPCVLAHGDGAIERVAFPETCGEKRGDAELTEIAERLLTNERRPSGPVAQIITRASSVMIRNRDSLSRSSAVRWVTVASSELRNRPKSP